MQEFLSDWRLLAATLLMAKYVGNWLFKVTPPPDRLLACLDALQRAGKAGDLANYYGMRNAEIVADLVGVSAAAEFQFLMRRQRRKYLMLGVVVSAIFAAVLFQVTPITRLPDWAFGAAGIFGAYQPWRAW